MATTSSLSTPPTSASPLRNAAAIASEDRSASPPAFICPITQEVMKDPVTNELYLCTGPDLYAVDVETGEVELRGRIGADEQCNDLGATWVEVACLSP